MVLRVSLAVVFGLGLAYQALAQEEPVHWSLGKQPASVKPGETFRLQVTARIDAGWHLYSLTQGPPPVATRIAIPAGQRFVLDGRIDAPPPKTAFDQSFGIDTEFYTDNVTFTLPVKVTGQGGGRQTLKVQAYYQTCNDRICYPPKTVAIETSVQVAGGVVASLEESSPSLAATKSTAALLLTSVGYEVPRTALPPIVGIASRCRRATLCPRVPGWQSPLALCRC